MKLINATLRPGKVLAVEKIDGKFTGNIIASSPGIFSEKDFDKTEYESNNKCKLPPIMPFWDIFGGHSNTYSLPKELDEIWLLHLTDNPRLLYWFRKDPTRESNANLIESENVEILCNRDLGSEWATIYFSDGSGWVIGKGNSKILIRPDGSILLDSSKSNRAIDINDNCISLGTIGESAHPAAYGDILTQICLKILVCLDLMKLAAASNPYTSGIATAIGTIPLELKTLNEKINSQHVTLD